MNLKVFVQRPHARISFLSVLRSAVIVAVRRKLGAKWCQEPFLGRPLFRMVFFNP
jgi:hypothetical protein